MSIYLMLLAVCLVSGGIKMVVPRKKSADIIAFTFSFFLLAVLAMLRGEYVGADTDNYIQYFQDIRFLSFGELAQYSRDTYNPLEYGYKIYNWLLVNTNSSPQTITIANSLLFLVGLLVFIVNESDDWWLSLILFIMLGFYQLAMNMTPSCIASFMIFAGIRLIRQRKLGAYMILIIVAMQMHTAALLFLPLYWLVRVKVNKNRLIGIGVIIIVLTLGYGMYALVLAMIVPSQYTYYFSMAGIKYEQLIVCMVQIAVLGFSFYMAGYEKLFSEEYAIDVWIAIISVAAYMISINMVMFSRISFMFAPYMIVTVPSLLNKISNQNKRMVVTLVLIVFCLAQYIGRMAINNIGATMPYYFFGQQ